MEQVAGIPVLDRARCTACGDCIAVCAPGVLALVGRRLEFVKPDSCDYCGECEAICAEGAISCPYDVVLAPPENPRDVDEPEVKPPQHGPVPKATEH